MQRLVAALAWPSGSRCCGPVAAASKGPLALAAAALASDRCASSQCGVDRPPGQAILYHGFTGDGRRRASFDSEQAENIVTSFAYMAGRLAHIEPFLGKDSLAVAKASSECIHRWIFSCGGCQLGSTCARVWARSR